MTGPASAPSPGPTPSASGEPLADALQFSSATVDGGTFDGASLAGRPAVLWFWAAWCPRCRAAASHVAAVQADYASKVNVVGVAGLRSGRDSMTAFVRETGIGAFPSLADDEGAVWRKFGVTAQEFFVIVDSSGNVVHKGPLSSDELRDRVAALAG
ncbi:redoxin domain-containing protein [Actinoplanes friuliensis]|uniref:Redoxin domain-containing protein n=1 Tax=Actinoplanes friuliensis DSM 7358 TaxID=1246995 RepID=U5VYM3_9ACTN|nr:redoxin domain-containing protein [Actinoplanes friuliensis]AGZ40761.1 redoxin domain-containing protein [Actinoplanes friuliensis DSM 7358]